MQAQSPGTPQPASAWRVLAVTLTIQALVSMGVLAVPAMGPAVARALGVSPALLGGYIALVYVGALLASLMAAPLVARYGAMRTSQLALVLCAAGLALPAAWASLVAATAGAVLTGFGYGPVTPASSHLLARSTPAHRASLMFSLKQTGVPLGGVMAGAIAPVLAVQAGPRAALLAIAAACLVCALAAQPFRAALDGDREAGGALRIGSFGGGLRIVAAHPALKRLAAVSFAFSIVQMSLGTYLVTFLNEGLGWTLVAAGVALSVAQAGGAVGRVLWGWVTDRGLGAERMLALFALAMAACAAGTAALPAGVTPAVALVLLAAFGACAIGWNGVYLAEVARCAPPGQAAAATGGTLAVTFLGVVLGPVLFGALSGAAGSYRAGFLALMLPTLACAWAVWRGARATPA